MLLKTIVLQINEYFQASLLLGLFLFVFVPSPRPPPIASGLLLPLHARSPRYNLDMASKFPHFSSAVEVKPRQMNHCILSALTALLAQKRRAEQNDYGEKCGRAKATKGGKK